MKAAIVGVAGLALDAAEVALLRQHRPAGVILFARNIADPAQVAALTAQLGRVLPPLAVVMVDQEGGRVARLRPPHWLAHPSAGRLGALHAADGPAGLRAAWLTGALIGLEAAAAGIGVVCAPVLDRAVPGADAVIGDRAYAADPAMAGELAAAAAAGLLAAGVQPVGKHAPGHGRAMADSHLALPRLGAVDEADLAVFVRCAHLPWMMTAHIVYEATDPVHPATQSAAVIGAVIRGRIGFEGVLVSDDLTMHALDVSPATRAGDGSPAARALDVSPATRAGDGSPAARAGAALGAGCDLALHCSGVLEETAGLLAACPDATEAALVRLRTGLFLAERSRQALDASALLAERDALL